MFFQFDKLDNALIYPISYQPSWVVISILMAVLSSYAALHASFQAQAQTNFSTKLLWVLISSITFGVGIWAMHFIGMLALKLPCHVGYDLLETLLSIIPSILVCGLVFAIDCFAKNKLTHWLNSILLALGVASMHYSGMAAMLLEGVVRYNPERFTVSILGTIALAFLAIRIKANAIFNNKSLTLGVAIVLGIAVSVMHYSAIAAAYFIKNPNSLLANLPTNLDSLKTLVAAITSIIALLSLTLANYSRSKDAINQLKVSEERLKFTLESSGDCIWQWDLISDDVIFSSGWVGKLGFTQDSAISSGSAWINNIHPDDLAGVELSMKKCHSGVAPTFYSEYRLRGKQDWLWVLSRGKVLMRDKDNKPTEMLGTLIDISERKALASEIEYLAFYDSLTGLPNRWMFLDRLKQGLDDLQANHLRSAIIFIDLDGFKKLNDRQGHHVGDLLLQEVASRIKTVVRDNDVVARLSSDEFVVLLSRLDNDQFNAIKQAEDFSKALLSRINEKYILAACDHYISASVGIYVFDGSEDTIENILKHADVATYHAKKQGGSCICFFNLEMQKHINDRLKLEEDLRIAIAEQQFELHYQAQFKSQLGVDGAEVLIRWRHPNRGLVSPYEFIPVAEETGLILPIGQWVLNAACDQVRLWQDKPALQHLSLAINVSVRQFQEDNFVQSVIDAIQGDPLIGNKIKLELTESLLVENIDETIEKMKVLKAFGVRFSMDDFGTGYSSLSYLSKLPFDQLKIDQSFVRNININDLDNSIIRTIIGMGESLNMKVIAEGVETPVQRDFLLQHRCDYFQGYLFSKPVVLNEFEDLVSAKRT